MLCKICNVEIPRDDLFCPSCGQLVAECEDSSVYITRYWSTGRTLRIECYAREPLFSKIALVALKRTSFLFQGREEYKKEKFDKKVKFETFNLYDNRFGYRRVVLDDSEFAEYFNMALLDVLSYYKMHSEIIGHYDSYIQLIFRKMETPEVNR